MTNTKKLINRCDIKVKLRTQTNQVDKKMIHKTNKCDKNNFNKNKNRWYFGESACTLIVAISVILAFYPAA